MIKVEMICIVCPLGCRITVEEDKGSSLGYNVCGNKCIRGQKYGIEELSNPTRVITSTVKILNGLLNRLPVKTNGAIPKDLNFECMKMINEVEIKSPIKMGDIIINNILGTGINLVASRSM